MSLRIEDLINRSVPALSGLASQLEGIAARYPDLAVSLQPKIDALRAVADPARLAALATTVVAEITALVQTGEIKPKQHPSDLAS